MPGHRTLRWRVGARSSTDAGSRTRTGGTRAHPRALDSALARGAILFSLARGGTARFDPSRAEAPRAEAPRAATLRARAEGARALTALRSRVLALLCAASWLGVLCAARAQDTPSTVAIDYAAPAGCPSRDTFEARLRARLGGAALSVREPVRLAVELRADARRFYGSIALSDAHGVLGPRAIEAERCSEAVDALTFVAALLLDDRARAADQPRPAARTPAVAGDTHGRRASQTAGALPRDSRPGSTPATATPEAAQREVQNPAPTTPDAAEVVAAAAPTAQADAPAPSDRASEPAGVPAEPSERAARAPSRLSGSLAVSALAASGVAPSVRPGLGVWGALSLPLAGNVSVSLALGVRTTLPQEVPSSEGTGTFGWWSSALALCAALGPPTGAVRGALCLDGEAGQIVAQGQGADQPPRVHAPWLALGPAARMSVHVRGPWRLAPGVGLLLPGTRDRFVIGQTELHQVPRLTFRGELALVVEWP